MFTLWQSSLRLRARRGVPWLIARFVAIQFTSITSLRDEAALLLLVVVGSAVCAALTLGLFGPRLLKSFVSS